MGGEIKTVVKNDFVYEMERSEEVSIFLSSGKGKDAEKFDAPWVRIEHSRKGTEVPGEYCVTYRDGKRSSRLEFEVSIKDGKVTVNSKVYIPSKEEYAMAQYDPFHEGVSLPESIQPCYTRRNGNEVIIRPDSVGSFENYRFPDLNLDNLFIISPKGILFNNQIFVGFAQDGSLMAPINKNLKRD
jgi:hypothetical protein